MEHPRVLVDHSRGVGVSVPRVGLDRAPQGDMEHPFRCGYSGNTTHRCNGAPYF